MNASANYRLLYNAKEGAINTFKKFADYYIEDFQGIEDLLL